MKNLFVREAEVKDAHEIAKIHVKTWQCAYKGIIPDSYLNELSVKKKTEGWRERLSNKKSESKTYVVELNNKVVGFVSVGPCRDNDLPSNVGELWSIYVDQNNIGKGIGTLLHNSALDYLRNLKFQEAILWVITLNEKTRKWYESKGWKVEGKTAVDSMEDFTLHKTRYKIHL